MVCVIIIYRYVRLNVKVRIYFKPMKSLDEVLQLTSPLIYGIQVSSRNQNIYVISNADYTH